jgi:hypothetical protein
MSKGLPLVIFSGYVIRTAQFKGETYYSVVDFVAALTDSPDPKNYWSVLKARDFKEETRQHLTNCKMLKLKAEDGKMRETDCANIDGLFRILQSVPSPKAEPAKLWLAKAGSEKLQRRTNPRAAVEGGRQDAFNFYLKKGFTPEHAFDRIDSIQKRHKLTDLYKAAGIEASSQYALLTATNHHGAFGITPKEHKDLKQLKKSEPLRDHYMSEEYYLSSLSEELLAQAIRDKKAQTPAQVAACVKDNADMMHDVRSVIEKRTGKKVATAEKPKKFLE